MTAAAFSRFSSDTVKPSIVLVHGAFADATGWQHVIPLLERDGYTVTAVQNPLTSVADDIATTRRSKLPEDTNLNTQGANVTEATKSISSNKSRARGESGISFVLGEIEEAVVFIL